jgi:hypothetical protein
MLTKGSASIYKRNHLLEGLEIRLVKNGDCSLSVIFQYFTWGKYSYTKVILVSNIVRTGYHVYNN